MASTRAHRCLGPGLSILVGTVDVNGAPSCCRGIALKSDDELGTVTVYLPVATSHETIRNVATTKHIAVSATHPIQNVATQLKGTTLEARLARDDEAPLVRGSLEAFADLLDGIGVPKRLTRSVSHWPAFAVTLRVEQVFDQTPGPNAGTPIR